MGFSSEAILIKPSIEEGHFTSFLQRLGVEQPQFNRKAFFEEADTKEKSGIYIGNYKGVTFLIFEGIAEDNRGSDNFTPFERELIKDIPEYEILSIANFESSNSYLYHYIKDGKTVRLKQGNYPDILHNVGQELAIEKTNYVKKELDVDGEEVYYTISELNPNDLHPWGHDQIGSRTAFDITKMFIKEAYSDIPLDMQLHQYLPKKEWEKHRKIPAPKPGENIRYFNRKLIRAEFVPYLEEHIIPFFQSKGFKFKPEKFSLVREINSIQQYLHFSFHPDSELLFDLHLSFEVNASQLLKEWSINKYNQHTFGNGNEIDNRQPILKYEHQLPDVPYNSDAGIIDTEQYAMLLLNYAKDNILPYFELFAGFKAFAEYSYYKCFRADFYYMMGESEKALRVLAELYESVHDQETRSKYLNDIQLRLRYELPDTPLDELLKMVVRDDHNSERGWGTPPTKKVAPPIKKAPKKWWERLLG